MPCRHADCTEIKRHSLSNFSTLPLRGGTQLGGWCDLQSHFWRFREETNPLAPVGHRPPALSSSLIHLVAYHFIGYAVPAFQLGQLQHYKSERTFTPVYLFEKYKWSDNVAQSILNLDTRWRRMVNFTPRPVYPQGRSLRYSLNRWLDGIQNQPVHSGEIIFSDFDGIDTQFLSRSARNLITTPTTLSHVQPHS